METKRLCALRGACQCRNEAEDISGQVIALYDELLSRNNLAEKDMVSLVFSLTPDLDAKNPASALRSGDRAHNLALFAVQEASVQGSLDHTIRVLIHCYLEAGREPVHVYRNGAEVLRPDWAARGNSQGNACE